MVAGATRIGVNLSRRLEEDGVPVTLIDERREACEKAAAALDDTLVIHGSPTDRELLREEGAERVEGFVACTDGHEENVVACLLAGRMGAAHTFALVDNAALSGLVGDLGIDAVISPRLLSVSLALQFARKGRIKAVAALLGGAGRKEGPCMSLGAGNIGGYNALACAPLAGRGPAIVNNDEHRTRTWQRVPVRMKHRARERANQQRRH